MRYNLAVALYKAGRIREAACELEAVRKAQPDHAAAPLLLADCRLQLGEWKQVIAILDPLLEKDPENQAILYMIGTALMRDRQYERGQRVLDRILRQGDSAEAHLVLAIASREANDDIAAEKELRRALELNPALPTANGTLGEVLAKMGDAPGAVEALRRELAINPNHFDSHVLLALLLRQDSRNDEAREHLQKALALRPGDPGALYQLALVEIAAGRARAGAPDARAPGEGRPELHRGARLAGDGLLPPRAPRGRQPRAGDRAAAQGRGEGARGRGEGATAGAGGPALTRGRAQQAAASTRAPAGIVRPIACATRRAFSMSAGNSESTTACGPSERAFAGSGCVSMSSPSAPHGDAGEGQALHPVALAGRVRGVDDRPGGPSRFFAIGTAATSSVKRVAVSNVRIPRSHSTTSGFPSREDVLGGVDPLVDRAAEAALEHHRHARAAERLQQRDVLHVPAADLGEVHVAPRPLDLPLVQDLADGEQAEKASAASRSSFQPSQPRPWKAVGDVRTLKAPPRRKRAPHDGHDLRRVEDLLARLDRARPGHHHQLGAADRAVPDRHGSHAAHRSLHGVSCAGADARRGRMLSAAPRRRQRKRSTRARNISYATKRVSPASILVEMHVR